MPTATSSPSAAYTPDIKGWCPGALQPMASGDGLVVRVRPPMGRLTLRQAARLARLAGTHASGLLELSSRANIQLRGVHPERHAAVLRALAGCGLLDADVLSERRRNVVIDPLHRPGDGVQELATALLQILATATGLNDLPAKFGWSIDGGHGSGLHAVSADIRFERAPYDGAMAWYVRPAGLSWALPASNVRQAMAAGLALARWFARRSAQQRTQGQLPGRLSTCSGEMNGLRAASTSAAPWPPGLPEGMDWISVPPTPAAPPEPPGLAPGVGWLVGAPLGRLAAPALARLVRTLQRQALSTHWEVRATPWRMLLIAPPSPPSALRPLFWNEAGLDQSHHWITHAADARLRVSACTGAPGCPQGQAPTQPLALALAPHVPNRAHLHVTGCAKGCARQAPATITLRAEPSSAAPLFAVVRHGAATGFSSERIQAATLQDNPGLLFEKY